MGRFRNADVPKAFRFCPANRCVIFYLLLQKLDFWAMLKCSINGSKTLICTCTGPKMRLEHVWCHHLLVYNMNGMSLWIFECFFLNHQWIYECFFAIWIVLIPYQAMSLWAVTRHLCQVSVSKTTGKVEPGEAPLPRRGGAKWGRWARHPTGWWRSWWCFNKKWSFLYGSYLVDVVLKPTMG